jgi:heavy metal sensor kinase
MSSRLAAIPIRVRLVLGFTLLMALVLALIGSFVYTRTSADLDRQIARELDARMAGVIAIVRDDGDDLGDPEQDPLGRVDSEGAVQVIGPAHQVADATSDGLKGTALLTPAEISALIHGEQGAVDVDGPDGHLRVIAARSQDDGVRYTIIVGASLQERDQALATLSRLLLIGGPIALLLSALAAYWVARAALGPVDAMRRRAAEISDDDPGQRLPVGPADDEISELASTLNSMLARLEEAIERERRFVADASHELRTPLTILKAEIELALAEGRSAGELRSALVSGGEEVDRLAQLADDLLVLARADDGRLPLHRERLLAADLAAKVADGFKPHLDGRRIELSIEPDLYVDADPLRLEQALSNLIANAIRYGAGNVEIAWRRKGAAIVISVADRGPGFTDDLLDHATVRFARGNGRRNAAGAGLGLAIVESIADAHGGSVSVANRDGGGAAVTIAIPASEPVQSF